MNPQALPAYHLQPAHGWINDPNGMVFHDGRWHVFYQHNPAAPVHDAIAWGHASSDDLVTWRDHALAFGPTPGGPDSHGCWSGVAVTGLERPAVVYSGVVDASAASTIVLRWGSDDLEEWGEPIVVGTTPVDDGVAVMRDPFVFSWQGHRWGLVGAGAEDGTPRVLVYDCDDILDWRYRGTFLDGHDPVARTAAANIWECPQLVVPDGGDEPALIVLSLWAEEVLGAVVGLTGRIVWAGDHPVLEADALHPIDTGDSFYAPQVAPDPAGEAPLMLGWVRETDTPGDSRLEPPTRPVSGCLSLPRRVRVRDGGVEVTLDPAVEGLPLGVVAEAGPGRHGLVPHGRVEMTHGEGHLIGTDGDRGTRVPLAPGTVVYVDADVAEVVAPGVVPATHRTGPEGWVLELDPGGRAEVREVTAEGWTFPAR